MAMASMAGYYISTMIALAFECNDVHKIVSQAIESMPRKSQYYRIIKDVIDFHDKNPDDFKACWKFINDKYLEHHRRLQHREETTSISPPPSTGHLSLSDCSMAMGTS